MLSYSHSLFLYTALLKLADALTALGVWYACWYLRFDSQWVPIPKGTPNFSSYEKLALPLALVVSLMLHVVGAYRTDRITFGFRSLHKIVQGAILGSLVFVATCYFLNEMDYSRVFLVLYAALLAVFLVVERGLLHLGWLAWMKKGMKRIRVLLIGHGELLDMYVGKLRERRPYPIEWVGQLKGSEADLSSAILRLAPDQVVVSFPEEESTAYTRTLEVLSEELVEVKVLPDFGKYSTFTYSAQQECGVPLLAFNQAPVGSTDRALKRVFDVAGSTAFLVFCSPLYLVLAAATKLSSKGPVFFSQERVGADGKRFQIYKYRTMRVNAEAATGPVWAVENDPRTTTLGSWLRRTSLDEIPQFWNVLKGDMSLVGPRPERPEFVQQFRKDIPKYMLRHKMKSGITGWAQINGWRGNTSINERIKHDLFYIGHWSHRFDLKIIVLTFFKGFVHRHAY